MKARPRRRQRGPCSRGAALPTGSRQWRHGQRGAASASPRTRAANGARCERTGNQRVVQVVEKMEISESCELRKKWKPASRKVVNNQLDDPPCQGVPPSASNSEAFTEASRANITLASIHSHIALVDSRLPAGQDRDKRRRRLRQRRRQRLVRAFGLVPRVRGAGCCGEAIGASSHARMSRKRRQCAGGLFWARFSYGSSCLE